MTRSVIITRCDCRQLHVRLPGFTVDCHSVRWGGGACRLAAQQMKIVRLLAFRFGTGPVPGAELVSWVWGEEDGGGPLYAAEIIASQMARIRRRMVAAGFQGQIINRFGFGYELELPKRPSPLTLVASTEQVAA